MKVAAINAQSGIATTRGYWQYLTTGWKYFLPHDDAPLQEIGSFLKTESVDVAFLSEITESSLRSGFRSQMNAIAAAARFEHAQFFPATRSVFASEGNAIMSRHPLSGAKTRLLEGHGMPRVLGEAFVDSGGGALRLLATHLSLNAKDRKRQIEEVARIAGESSGACVLAGDFNEPDDAAFSNLRALGFQEISRPSFPSWKPREALDRIFARGARLSACAAKDALFSDHVPLIAEITGI